MKLPCKDAPRIQRPSLGSVLAMGLAFAASFLTTAAAQNTPPIGTWQHTTNIKTQKDSCSPYQRMIETISISSNDQGFFNFDMTFTHAPDCHWKQSGDDMPSVAFVARCDLTYTMAGTSVTFVTKPCRLISDRGAIGRISTVMAVVLNRHDDTKDEMQWDGENLISVKSQKVYQPVKHENTTSKQ